MSKATANERVRLHGGDYALAYAAWALHESDWDLLGEQASDGVAHCAHGLPSRNKFGDRQKALRLLRSGKAADAAKCLGWPMRVPSTAPHGRAIWAALDAAGLFRSDADRQSTVQLAAELCRARGFDPTWGVETVDAKAPLEPVEFVRAYEGPMGRVAAVQTQFNLSTEHAAQVVRQADSPEPVQAPMPTVGDALARCDESVRRAFEALTQEVITLRRINRSLRTLVHEYLPQDG